MQNSFKMWSKWKYSIVVWTMFYLIRTSLTTNWENAHCGSGNDVEVTCSLVKRLLQYIQNGQQDGSGIFGDLKEQIQKLQNVANGITQGSTYNELNLELQTKLNKNEKQLTDLQEEKQRKDSTIQEKEDKIKELNLKIKQQTNEFESRKKTWETQLKAKNFELELKVKLIEETKKENKNLEEQNKSDSALIKDLNIEIAKYKEMECLTYGCPNETTNGIHLIKVEGLAEAFQADCDSTINGTGWIVIQRRIDESVSFDRSWAECRTGFGENQGNYFIGLEKLHLMTQAQPYELYIHLQKANGETLYARYNNFIIGNESESYELKSLGEYTGTAGDGLSRHLNYEFQTRDRYTGESCSKEFGPWWYKHDGIKCDYSNLNGKHFNGSYDTIRWSSRQYNIKFKLVQMMIRKKYNDTE